MRLSPGRVFAHVRTGLAVALIAIFGSSAARAEWQRYASGVVGTLTEGSWHEAVRPPEVQFADSHLIGGAIGWDRPIGASRFRYGAEAQLVRHFGRPSHFEVSVPVVLRYMSDASSPVTSFAAGLGLSYTTRVPQVEIDRNGNSQRLFVHWMAEIEFALQDTKQTAFVRLHHRSDGYGLFEVDAGSTGFVFGLRHRF
ncbi:hypothetical protein GCM10007385_34090 [Tateyamaria omphalii]|uniref:hypothetical protein n=1 Tax=Tateyamaria omphalii TaxID=299262 RepID=UPI0016751C22|nr:hypothetical protein [Tateyamaria omphalii]GGX62167.1 hypothetical protein GCM10007385_34090 [Tateyamaria omphalii]